MEKRLFITLYLHRDAAEWAGIASTDLHNWINRELVYPLHADKHRKPGKKRRFSAFDIIRLAIMKYLVPFGVPIDQAWGAAGGVFQGEANVVYIGDLSPAEIAHRLRKRTIFICGGDAAYGAPPNDSPAVLTVDVARIVYEILDEIYSFEDAERAKYPDEIDDLHEALAAGELDDVPEVEG
jgi:hypothetical protein